MEDSVEFAAHLRDFVSAQGLSGFGHLRIEDAGVALWWKDGEVPLRVMQLVMDSGVKVAVRSCPYSERELQSVVQRLVDAWNMLPFTMTTLGALSDASGVQVGVAEPEVGAAQAYFSEHPLRLETGDSVHVTLEPTGYPPVIAFPLQPGTAAELSTHAIDRFVGLGVNEATVQALEDGWLVRSFTREPGVAVTLDMRADRLNLCHDKQGIVKEAHVG